MFQRGLESLGHAGEKGAGLSDAKGQGGRPRTWGLTWLGSCTSGRQCGSQGRGVPSWEQIWAPDQRSREVLAQPVCMSIRAFPAVTLFSLFPLTMHSLPSHFLAVAIVFSHLSPDAMMSFFCGPICQSLSSLEPCLPTY